MILFSTHNTYFHEEINKKKKKNFFSLKRKKQMHGYFDVIIPLPLWADSADDKLILFLIFLIKQVLTFYANCLLSVFITIKHDFMEE